MIILYYGDATARLEVSGKWVSSTAPLTTYLNAMFPKALYPDSPSEGIVGAAQARAAGEALGAKITYPKTEQDDPDRVY